MVYHGATTVQQPNPARASCQEMWYWKESLNSNNSVAFWTSLKHDHKIGKEISCYTLITHPPQVVKREQKVADKNYGQKGRGQGSSLPALRRSWVSLLGPGEKPSDPSLNSAIALHRQTLSLKPWFTGCTVFFTLWGLLWTPPPVWKLTHLDMTLGSPQDNLALQFSCSNMYAHVWDFQNVPAADVRIWCSQRIPALTLLLLFWPYRLSSPFSVKTYAWLSYRISESYQASIRISFQHSSGVGHIIPNIIKACLAF